MPELSRFYGIVIQMYFDDHPPPHFHAIYAGSKVAYQLMPVFILPKVLPWDRIPILPQASILVIIK